MAETTLDGRTEGVSVAEAATALGITSDAVYKGLRRKTYRGYKDVNGKWRVILPETGKVPIAGDSVTSGAVSHGITQSIITQLRSEVEFLRAELTARRQEIERRDDEIRRRDVIIANLSDRIPQLAAKLEPIELKPADSQRGGHAERRRFWQRLFR